MSTIPTVRPIPTYGHFTAWVTERGIECLVRSADWYKLTPIQRYLYNCAASDIRMEDCKTELRVYSFEDFDHLRDLLETSKDYPADAAREAWILFCNEGDSFGVVHLVTDGPTRGDRISGDDPADLRDFIGEPAYVELVAKFRDILRDEEDVV